MIAAEVDTAALFSGDRAADHQLRHLQHVLKLPSGRVGKLPRQHVAAPALDSLEGFGQVCSGAFHPHLPPHERPQRIADVGQVERLVRHAIDRSLLLGIGDRRHLKHAAVFHAPGGNHFRARRLTGAGSIDEALEKAVTRQTVGAMQAAGSDLPGGEQAGNACATVIVDRDSADHVMGAGPHRNPIAGEIEAKLPADLGHAGKPLPHDRRVEVREIEIHIGVVGAVHHLGDRPGDDVARSEFCTIVEVGHEAVAIAVDEPGPGAPHGLGDQTPRAAGDVEHRGMKLHELHVTNLGTGPPGEGHAVAAGARRVGRFAINLPDASGGQNRLLGPHECLAVCLVPDERPTTAALMGDQIDRERVGPHLEVVERPRPLDHGPHHLPAGGVAKRMNDAVMAVAAFAAQFERTIAGIEPRAPGDQFVDPRRSLAYDRIHHILMAEPSPRGQRVGHMVVEPVFGIDDPGDASLGPLARRPAKVVFRDDGDRQPGIDRQGRPQAGKATTEDQHVGEAMGHPLGAEGDEIPRPFEDIAADVRHSPLVPWRYARTWSRYSLGGRLRRPSACPPFTSVGTSRLERTPPGRRPRLRTARSNSPR